MTSLILLAVAGFFDTFGDIHSYAASSSDGRITAVMIAPVPIVEDVDGLAAHASDEVRDLRANFSASGLYRVGVVSPIWTIPIFEEAILVPSDGAHLVAYDPIVKDPSIPFLRFYRDGVVVKSYRLSEVALVPRMCPRTSSGGIACVEGIRLLDSDHRVLVNLQRGMSLELDLDGNVTQRRFGLVLPLLFALLVGSLVSLLGFWFYGRTPRSI